jgi:hypothetical protein
VPSDWRTHLAVPLDQELKFRTALLKLGYAFPGQPRPERVNHCPLCQQLFHVAVRQSAPQYQRIATKVTCGGNRNPVKLDRGAAAESGLDASTAVSSERLTVTDAGF